ncbi:RNase H domain protein [Xylariomycetidae sp. FL2044]|nr:RNase H domain protein [Xylariomycetidae sp. FL2044]
MYANHNQGSGPIYPTKFTPPNLTVTPRELFPGTPIQPGMPPVARFVRLRPGYMKNQHLIYTGGCCLNDGEANPRAGWAFVFGPRVLHFGPGPEPTGLPICTGRLEQRGPTGHLAHQTKYRAELRAVVAALAFRYWLGEGASTLVFATDSDYVVQGATDWIHGLVSHEGRLVPVEAMSNMDLWEKLLSEVKSWAENGLQIQFWKIPPNLNSEARGLAEKAAETEDAPSEFTEVTG